MAAQSGFQPNTTITSAFWWYKPSPPEVGQNEIMLEINAINHIEATNDHSKVWVYYSASTGSTNSQPLILTGDCAAAFMSDMESLFQ